MKLFTHKLCPFAQRVHIALAERNLEALFELSEVNLESLPKDLLDVNALGQVPTLELSKGFGIYESMQILMFLDSLPADGPKLFGETPSEAIQLDLFCQRAAEIFLAPLLGVLYCQGNLNKRNAALAKLPHVFSWLNNSLEARQPNLNSGAFLGGVNLNAVDCAVAPFAYRYARLCQTYSHLPMPSTSSLANAYFTALLQHPSVVKTSPTDDELQGLFARFFLPTQTLQSIINASREICAYPMEELLKLNESLGTGTGKNVSFNPQKPGCWQLGQTPAGPHIEGEFVISSQQALQKALEILVDLQESVDHHSHFVIEGYHKLIIQLCTHEPQWGISAKDLVFAQVISNELLAL